MGLQNVTAAGTYQDGWNLGEMALKSIDQQAGGRDLAARFGISAIDLSTSHVVAYNAAKIALQGIASGQDRSAASSAQVGLQLVQNAGTNSYQEGWQVGQAMLKTMTQTYPYGDMQAMATAASRAIDVTTSHVTGYNAAQAAFQTMANGQVNRSGIGQMGLQIVQAAGQNSYQDGWTVGLAMARSLQQNDPDPYVRAMAKEAGDAIDAST